MAKKINISESESLAKAKSLMDKLSYDEKKAFELSSINKYGFSVEESNAAYNAALEMARWKDEQYKEEKREVLGLVKMLKVDEHNQTIIEDLVAMLNL